MASSPESSKTDDIVVFEIVRDSVCAECGEELGRGRRLRLERDRPLCMSCADLAHLVFLPSGDAALTRRAGRYSSLKAVVVRFSRARKRYERQGILVDEAALGRAEKECLADADVRERVRERQAERANVADERYRAEFAQRLRELYPGCPPAESIAIAEHACAKYSGRVGRSADAKRLDSDALGLAVRAHVRHVHTRYDGLLGGGWDPKEGGAKAVGKRESFKGPRDGTREWSRSPPRLSPRGNCGLHEALSRRGEAPSFAAKSEKLPALSRETDD